MSLREKMTTSGARPGKTRCRHERVVRSIQNGTNDDRRHGELGRLASRMTLMGAAAWKECDLADAPGQATCSGTLEMPPSLSPRSRGPRPHAGHRRKEKHHAPFCTSSDLALWEANPSICEGVAATRGLFNLKRTS